MARVIAIIPARLASSRFSRKLLYPLNGKPLLYYVWRSVRRAKLIDGLYVATDDEEIGEAVTEFGGNVIMTSNRPRNGTERVAEAMVSIKGDIVVNIQGDNFGLPGSVCDRVIAAMKVDRSIHYATLARPITGRDRKKRRDDPNVVKVIENADGNAAWFSRYPIPYVRSGGRRRNVDRFAFLEHIGVYFLRRKALEAYVAWSRGPAERAESLEQLRVLEHGKPIRLFKTRAGVISVDSRDAIHSVQRSLS